MEEQGLKRFYGEEVAQRLGEQLVVVYPAFDVKGYTAAVRDGVVGLELKARVRVLMEEMRVRLPADYPEAVAIILKSLGPELDESEGMFTHGWFWAPTALFVQEYGLAHPELSLTALNQITRRNTAEEAIRPYIIHHYDTTMQTLRGWVKDDNFHVRRLVSEGTRPRLPWAMRLDAFIRDPHPSLELLEVLRDDPVPFVQKSVANHLNDIAKDHPDVVLDVAERWMSDSPTPQRAWIVRHGLRNLIKAGNSRALALIGADAPEGITLENFTVSPTTIAVGDTVAFGGILMNSSQRTQTLVIDYAIHFVLARGKTGKKVFKLTTIDLASDAQHAFTKRHSFKPITTRRYYPGVHRIEIQVNGQVMADATIHLEL